MKEKCNGCAIIKIIHIVERSKKMMYVLVKKGCIDILECGTASECKKTKRELINAHKDLEDKLFI